MTLLSTLGESVKAAWASDSCQSVLLLHIGASALINVRGVFGEFLHMFMYGYPAIIALHGFTYLLAVPGQRLLFLSDFSSTSTTAVVMAVYGTRLGVFMIYRNWFSQYWNTVTLKEGPETKMRQLPFFTKLAAFCGLSLLLGTYVLPIFYKHKTELDTSEKNVFFVKFAQQAGNAVAIVGVTLQAVADHQKLQHKYIKPKEPIMSGVYKLCRHPNYFGEVLVHLGIGAACVSGCRGFFTSMGVMLPPLMCGSVMYSSTKDLEQRHQQEYGENAEYKKYKKETPCLIPLPGLGDVCSCE